MKSKPHLPILLAVLLAPAAAQDGGAPAAPPAGAQRGGADPSDDALRMGSPPELPQGLAEEDMWPAATAEGWRKPCLVRWQRSFDDALAVARAQNRPILVAVNMDGEIASEHFAGVRYRDPETAALLNRYVCVIASVYRHTPRDYDEEGRRVECPRFGTVTCGEHIQAERDLYDKYFDGKRIAPRHIVLDLDGAETYDVYYAWDTKSVVTTFVKGVEGWPEPNESPEPTLANLAKSRDVADRQVLERAYVEGDDAEKRKILVALQQPEAADQVEVLRTAIFGFDLEHAHLARRALALCETEPALDVMAEALKVPLEPEERELLLGAVDRLAGSSPRARTLAALHSGLSLASRHLGTPDDPDLAREYEANAARPLDVQARADAAEARPTEPGALLDLAEGLLARAQELGPRYAGLMREDARSALEEARRLGASGPRLDAVLALQAFEDRDFRTAHERAVAAVEGGVLRLDGPAEGEEEPLSELTRARVLRLFGEARRARIREAYRAGQAWDPEWLSDVNAAWSLLAKSPLVDPETLVEHHDFLRWIGATPRADAVLDEALERFPDSPLLHDRLRARLLWEGGPEALERGYEARLAEREADGASPGQLEWFAGYASLVAAEHLRRRSRFEEALAAYERAAGHYERHLERFPDAADDAHHYLAMGLAGRARVALELGRLDQATSTLVAALELRPDSAANLDGLGITPVATAKMLRARLLDAGDEERATLVQGALDTLDPRLLEPPPTELPGARGGGRAGGRADDGGRRGR